MPTRYLLDTNACIHIRSRRVPSVVEHFEALGPGETAMSIVTYGKLRLGAEKSVARDRALLAMLRLAVEIPVRPMTVEAAEHYRMIRADLERRGEMIGANDLWIAAHARAAGLTLVTNNEREFRRVPGLAVENRAAP